MKLRIPIKIIAALLAVFAIFISSYLTSAAQRKQREPSPDQQEERAMEQKRPPSMVAPEVVPSSKWDERMIELDLEALDEAYRDTISKLFAVWMRDPTGQP